MRQQFRRRFGAARVDSALVTKGIGFYDQLFELAARGSDSATIRRTLTETVRNLRTQLSPEDLFKLEIPPNDQPLLRGYARSFTSPWSRYFLTYDPAPDWGRVRCPVLAVNGTLDTQVDADQNLAAIERNLKAGRNNRFVIKRLDGLNHLFQRARTGHASEYLSLPPEFDSGALLVIGDWLQKTLR
jgi:fermentation-respiration switch protein FrsA (DUF1100 family)